jgi:5-formyltetrahydrofolate cyclo-ligase
MCSTANPTTLNRTQLRRHFRQLRRSLSAAQQAAAARRLKRAFFRSPLALRHRHVALYLANDGEISPHFILSALLQRSSSCYLPVLHPVRTGQLLFCRLTGTTRYQTNRFGIMEPMIKGSQLLPARLLGLVLLPLVAFDVEGNRLGMGGGYYDRSFAFRHCSRGALPVMIGLAHECQKAARLPVAGWDLPLDGVLTDQKFYAGKR